MSHFGVMVALPTDSEDELAKALQPYHEFECTGVLDQYVKRVVCDDYSRSDYEKDTVTAVCNEDGKIFLAKYSNEAQALFETDSETGVLIVPDWLHEKEVPAKDLYPTYEQWLKEYQNVDVDGKFYDLEDGVLYTYTNPDSKWDWWQLGGRLCGHFAMKHPAHTDMISFEAKMHGYEEGERSWATGDVKPDHFSKIRKCGVDLFADWEAVKQEKVQAFDLYLETVKDLPPYISFEDLRDRKDMTTDVARQVYWSQLQVKALGEVFDNNRTFFPTTPETFFLGDRDAYMKKAKYRTCGTYATLVNGKWESLGEKGWFGCSRNESSNWAEHWFEIWESIPEDYWLFVVDCHI